MALFQIDEMKAPDERPRDHTWTVYNHYEVGQWGDSRAIHAPRELYRNGKFHKNTPKKDEEGRDWYTLLRGMSGGGLFVDFARLVEDEELDVPQGSQEFDTDKNEQVALKWAHEWGVLGLTRTEDGWYDTRGGEADTVTAFVREAWVANSILRLYEEATSEDGDLDPTVIATLLEQGGVSRRWARFCTRTQEVAKDYAIRACEEVVHTRLRDYCFPALFRELGQYKYTQGFGSANLLGAIWMGMFWILWDRQTDRCRNPECNHIIPYDPTPERRGTKKNDRSEGYATRKDKVYCSPRCEKRHYYLRRTKPAREAAKARRST